MIPSKDLLASEVLRSFATERRRVFSIWRLRIHLSRLALRQAQPLPSQADARAILRRLLDRRDAVAAYELKDVFIIESAYANQLALAEEHLIMESDPLAFFSHLTALLHHGLTDVIPNRIFATAVSGTTDRLPLGTTADDWTDLTLPRAQMPATVRAVPVVWTRDRTDWGVTTESIQGSAIYLSDLERTLLDSLREPSKAHGVGNVFAAWRTASHRWDLDRLLTYADRGPTMRQRVGFLVEQLGQSHPRLEQWRTSLQRGGSLKLLASEPYSPRYSETWNLSLNVPGPLLAELHA